METRNLKFKPSGDLWRAVQARDAAFEGDFVYAVKTTGIYCLNTCPSRRPHSENVLYFESATEAEASGYRPCKRCRPRDNGHPDPTVGKVLAACRLLEDPAEQPPTLAALGARTGMSPGHLRRKFTQMIGVSPRRYGEARRFERLRHKLRNGDDIAGAVYESGFGSGSRVYEKANRYLGMTPGAYRQGGRGQVIEYAIVPCPLGTLLVAGTERGLCSVALGEDAPTLLAELEAGFSEASLVPATAALGKPVEELVRYLAGDGPWPLLPLDVRATAFQTRVWDALRRIPPGETPSYQDVARAIGQPSAARAVANACASNPVALAIPCHRIVRKDGRAGGYRWGPARKFALIQMEKGGQ